jgi:vacuolar-type H+-ATPase catalytic subunit A/Vma1
MVQESKAKLCPYQVKDKNDAYHCARIFLAFQWMGRYYLFSLERNKNYCADIEHLNEAFEETAMELIINDVKTKELLTEVVIELIQQRREVFLEIIQEALEEVGLANAIREGRTDEFVSEDRILRLLEGDS